MDRDVMVREAFGVREACFRFAMKPVKLSDEPYVRRGSSPPKSEMLPLRISESSESPNLGRSSILDTTAPLSIRLRPRLRIHEI